jgi:thiol:disulfide interchange protein DsbD
MVGVKAFFAVVMIVVALYFLKNAFPVLAHFARNETTFLVLMAQTAILGVALGAIHLEWSDGGIGVKLRKGVGIALSVIGGFLFWASFDLPKEQPMVAMQAEPGGTVAAANKRLTWEHSEEVAVKIHKGEKRPMIVDFTADWCGACKQLTKETFSDPRVMATATKSNFVAVKIDTTDDEDPQILAVKGKYKVVGLPTVVIYDSNGDERKRFNEFVGPEQFAAALEGID